MKKKLSLLLCIAVTLCAMSSTALAAEPMTDADTVSAMISAADTLPGISAYPAEVRASEENGVYRLEKVYYLTAKDDPATIPTADFEREGRTYTLLDLLLPSLVLCRLQLGGHFVGNFYVFIMGVPSVKVLQIGTTFYLL